MAVEPSSVQQDIGAPDPWSDADVAALGLPAEHMFIGQSEDALIRHFGAADLVRKDGEATTWQVRTNSLRGPCVLIATLYEDGGSPARIAHMAVREDGAAAADPAWCLSRLALAYSARRTG